ncbi:MAG: valine--tRNA ligase, partial [Oligoflexales bacterium]|nr:valine--tRNA ligase [Oligoflexales bacterium]
FWEDEGIYKWDPMRGREETYIVDTPPPTVSGSLHVGHVFSYTQTDLIVRYQRMAGKNIFYPIGWDDNGLPTERRVQNVYQIQCDLNLHYMENWEPSADRKKSDAAESVSRKNFIEACSRLTLQDEEVFKALFRHLGLSMDWTLEYATIDSHCRKISQLSFLDLINKGEAYSLEAPTYWDVDYKTAVAQAELEDREKEGFYHHLRFKVSDDDAQRTGIREFIISTTRPELLAACIAVVAHPDDVRYKALFGSHAETPLFHAKVPIMASEHADPEKGSGILMICSFGDNADVDFWKRNNNLPIRQVIGRNGRLLDVNFGSHPFHSQDPARANQNYRELQGKTVLQAQKRCVELLREPSLGFYGKPSMVGEPEKTVRPVKFYEKGERPIEIISTRQWFIKILDHKKELIMQGEKIKWYPDHMKNRYVHWVEGLNQDWCISRQRYFGVPFPVWYRLNENGEPSYAEPVFASADTLPVDPTVDVPPGYNESQRNAPNGFLGETDVMDTWATSSLTPQVESHWGINETRHERLFPMNLRPQSHEIIRTWAFYTIVKAYLHENQVPWHEIAISGWILDPDRKKMSKSKNNVVTPEQYLKDFSADAVRYWAARARLGMDTAFDEKVFKIGRKVANKLFNAAKFVYSQTEGVDSSIIGDLKRAGVMLDRIWIRKMLSMITTATRSFENLDYAGALQLTEDMFWKFCDNYLEIVKVRAYKGDDEERLSALVTLNFSISVFIRLFAPTFPYLCEEIFSWKEASEKHRTVHKNTWPSDIEIMERLPDDFFDKVSDQTFTFAEEVVARIRAEKTKNQKNLRWPVASLKIKVSEGDQDILKGVLPDILRAGNVSPSGVTIESGEILEGILFELKVVLSETE